MHLAGAIALTLLKGALIILAMMGLLFVGSLFVSEGGEELRERLETPERLAELEEAGQRQTAALADGHARAVAHKARRQALEIRLEQERHSWQQKLDEELATIEEVTRAQVERIEESVASGQRSLHDSMRRREEEYCRSLNPLNWITCYAIRNRSEAVRDSMGLQQKALQRRAERLEEQAADQARRHMAAAEERLELQTEQFRQEIELTLSGLQDLETQRESLEEELRLIEAEEALLRAENWLWIELRQRWPYLLVIALLIFTAPFLRRTFWYFVGMPLVSKAAPIELSPSTSSPSKDEEVVVTAGESARTLEVEVDRGQRLLARTGYIQSDRQGARSEIFFDRQAPNLSYLSGLVLLTRLDAKIEEAAGVPLPPRKVLLGTPDEPDAYLMRVDLKNHPGVVLRASHVVAVVGDIKVDSTWRLTNLHAWATSQVRFITFSGTGSLILEGYGDIQASLLDDQKERKRMTLVVGFDTRLTYRTERSATFLPYLVDPGREPLVVDVFEGKGAVFYEKNPSARKRYRSTGEAIAGFFLDVFRRLLGL
jgi:hypothetical protein